MVDIAAPLEDGFYVVKFVFWAGGKPYDVLTNPIFVNVPQATRAGTPSEGNHARQTEPTAGFAGPSGTNNVGEGAPFGVTAHRTSDVHDIGGYEQKDHAAGRQKPLGSYAVP